jgi:hypothetical protein
MNRPGYDDAGHMEQIANRQAQLSSAIDDYKNSGCGDPPSSAAGYTTSPIANPWPRGIFVSFEVWRNSNRWCDCRRRGRDLVSRMSDSSSGFCLLDRSYMNVHRSGCGKKELQEAIASEFPAHPYSGPILAVSNDPSVYDVDTDNLDFLLKGKSWKELDPQFVESNHDEYVLMNELALPAFLGAWLWNAAEDVNLSNQVLSSLVFHLATYGGSEEQKTGLWGRGFKGLNQKQRDVIHLLLKCAAESGTVSSDRARIEQALMSVEINHCPK